MTCPHCGTQNIPDASTTCPQCGRALVPANGVERERPMAAEAPARRPYMVAGILAAIIVVLVVALVMATRPATKSVTQAPIAQPPVGPPVTAAPAPQPPLAGPPITQAPAVQPPALHPPQEDPNKAAVAAYIQRVGQIERRRQQLATNLEPLMIEYTILKAGLNNPLLGPMSDLLDPDPETAKVTENNAGDESAARVQKLIDDYVNQMRALNAQLRAIQPVPQPAFDFARAYDEALTNYTGAIVQISQILNTGISDPSQAQAQATKLAGMKGGLQLQAEQGLKNADAQLTSLTQRYGIPKPYDITDTPRGAVTGF